MNTPRTSKSEEASPVTLILLVEDDVSIGEVLVQAILSETSHHATLVPDGFQAVQFVRNLKPHLIVLDYVLPGMNGLEVYDQMQTMEGIKDVPVLFMSATVPRRELEKRNLPSLAKPFEVDELLRLIEQLLA